MSTSVSEDRKRYTHINGNERYAIAVLYYKTYSIRKIARILGRSPSTISEELKRNGGARVYDDETAEQKAKKRWRESHKKQRLANTFLRTYVHTKMKERCSPEQIVGIVSKEHPEYSLNHETIYLYVYEEARHLITYLRRSRIKRRKRRKHIRNRVRIPNRVSIHERGEIKHEYGHFEADLVGSSSKSTILAIREKKSQYLFLRKVASKKAAEVKNKIMGVMGIIPSELRSSITYDNGLENVLHEEINELYTIKSYFCDPYCAWQKGGVENAIGLVREYFPKRTNFNKVKKEDILHIEKLINNRPRKSLGFYTPEQLFGVRLIH